MRTVFSFCGSIILNDFIIGLRARIAGDVQWKMGRHFRIFWRGDIYVYIYTRRKKDVERRGKEKKERKKRREKKKSTSLGSFLE